MAENLENRISSTQAKEAIFKAHGIQSSASEIDGSVENYLNILSKDFSSFSDNEEMKFSSIWGGTIGATALPRVLNGKMTFSPVGSGAGYASYLHNDSVKRLFGKFSFGPFTTGNGSAVLICWDNDIKETYPIIPDSACHLVITPTKWEYSIIDNGTITVVATGLFSPNLLVDTDYITEVILDRNNAKAYVTLPDGQMVTVSHSKISYESKWSCFELFKIASTDSTAMFSSVFATCDSDSELGNVMNKIQSAQKPSIVQYAPTVTENVIVPTVATEISLNNLICPVVVPPSGKILVELSATLLHSAASNVLWVLTDDNAGSLATISASESIKTGNTQVKVLLTGLSVGRTLNLKWKHWATIANSATLKISKGSGWYAVMIATPVA